MLDLCVLCERLHAEKQQFLERPSHTVHDRMLKCDVGGEGQLAKADYFKDLNTR